MVLWDTLSARGDNTVWVQKNAYMTQLFQESLGAVNHFPNQHLIRLDDVRR